MVAFLFLPALNTQAMDKDTTINQIFNLIYNTEYSRANSALQKNANELDKIYYTVLHIDLSYWRYITGTDKPDYDLFESVLQSHNTANSKTFEQKAIRLITLSYQLRYELKRYKLLSAISTLKKNKAAFAALSTHTQVSDSNLRELLLLYNSMFSYFDNYLNVFGSKEKKAISQKALLDMEALTKSDANLVKTLASYFLAKTYLKYEKTPDKAHSHFKFLCEKYPGNHKFSEYLLECQNKLDN